MAGKVRALGQRIAAVEAILNSLTEDCPAFRQRWRTAAIRDFPALCRPLDADDDDMARMRCRSLPAAVQWLQERFPALVSVPQEALTWYVLLITPWIVNPTPDVRRLRFARPTPAGLDVGDAPIFDAGESRAAFLQRQHDYWQGVSAAIDAATPTQTDEVHARVWQADPATAWAAVADRPALQQHARWWAVSQVDDEPFPTIADRDHADRTLVGRTVRAFAMTHGLAYQHPRGKCPLGGQ